VFKKSEEQEWTRFRGALAKEREETPSTDASDSHPAAAPAASPQPAAPTPGPSFRPSATDVNVSLPQRLGRGMMVENQEVESIIGERTRFEGTFTAEGAVRVMGSVQGELQSKGTIIIEEAAHVTARVTGAQVSIAGQVDGQIHSDGRVEIKPTGRVTGEIVAGALIIQEGAFFDGSSKMAVATQAHAAANSTNSAGHAAEGSAGWPREAAGARAEAGDGHGASAGR
jgi:cytoskeletal protein CcmA (bactofilin family)